MNTVPYDDSPERYSASKKDRQAVAHMVSMLQNLGFRSVAGRPGFWYHEAIGVQTTLPLTVDTRLTRMDDVIAALYWAGVQAGRNEIQHAAREALGL